MWYKFSNISKEPAAYISLQMVVTLFGWYHMRQYSTHARLTDPQVSCAFLKFLAFTDPNIHCTGGCFNGNKQSRTTEHGLIISVQKTKLMAIKGRDLLEVKL